MKTKIYLKVAEGAKKLKVYASLNPSQIPLSSQSYRDVKYLPTVFFAINVDIPDEAFELGKSAIKEINLELKKNMGICADVEEIKS